MNSFGRIFRLSIFGESHGEAVGILVDGCPPGLPLKPEDFLPDLERRKGGVQKATTPRQEEDLPILLSGIFNGHTTGAPLLIKFENKNARSSDYEKTRALPRPGHADLVAAIKAKGFNDHRGGGHYSGRLTVALVAAGVIAKRILKNLSSDLTLKPTISSDLTSPTPLSKGGGETSPPNPLSKGEGEQSSKVEERLPGEPLYMRTAPREWKYMSQFAKLNRKNPTKAEKILWEALRKRKLDGFKFRRQHPINVFIPDFVCLEKNVVVEVDGDYHKDEDQKKFDELRDRWLEEFNFKMVRLTNDEVLNDLKSSLQKIRAALELTPATSLSTSPNPAFLTSPPNKFDLTPPTPLSEGEGGVEPVDREIKTSSTVGFGPPSPSERGLGGEVEIKATILQIAGEADIEKGIQKAIDEKDSVGGIIECVVSGLPAGLGEPFFDSVESVISHLVFAIPAVKAIEFGAGFKAAGMFGSQHNDAIIDEKGTTETNNAGGVLGGLTNGNDLVFRIAVKPTSSTPKEQNTFNLETGKRETISIKGRHDLCIALRVPVVLEAVAAIAVCDLMLISSQTSPPQPPSPKERGE